MTAPSSRDVSCQRLVELLTEYLEGVLPQEEVAEVDRHLAACDGCAAYLDQMRVTIDALGSVPVATLSEDVLDNLLEAFRGSGVVTGDHGRTPALPFESAGPVGPSAAGREGADRG